MNSAIDQGKLVSKIAFALRHHPDRFGLNLDEEGWTGLEDLVIAIRFDRYDWANIDEDVLLSAIRGMDRFEIREHRIRATYGHSIELGKLPPIIAPPQLLFHGTTEEALPTIRREGLKPMGRRFVHLTSDREYARCVANAKQGQFVLGVQAAAACAAGQLFRCVNARIWLTELVEARFLTTENEQGLA